MANNGANTNTTVSTAAPVMTWSTTRRRKAMRGTFFLSDLSRSEVSGSDIGPRRLAASDGPDQQPRQGVDHDRNQEERQTDLDQSRQVNIARSFAELIGQHAGHGVPR